MLPELAFRLLGRRLVQHPAVHGSLGDLVHHGVVEARLELHELQDVRDPLRAADVELDRRLLGQFARRPHPFNPDHVVPGAGVLHRDEPPGRRADRVALRRPCR